MGAPVGWEAAAAHVGAKSAAELGAQGKDQHELSGKGAPLPDLER